MNERYDRNIRILGFGEAGQQALGQARVLVIGAGGLGSPAILYLAAAGVGRLDIADSDCVAPSNLQRQILYTEADIGRRKAETACAAVLRLNGAVKTTPLCERLLPARLETLLLQYDCVLDCTDTREAKYQINDACVLLGVPFVHAGVRELSGQILSFAPGHACLRCVLPEPQAVAAGEFGTLGAAAGVLGAMQAAEAVKLLTGLGTPLLDTLLHVDLETGAFTRVHIDRSPHCPACGKMNR